MRSDWDDEGSFSIELLPGLRLRTIPQLSVYDPDVRPCQISIDTGGLTATAELVMGYVDWEGLVEFFTAIDRDWRGWSGEKRFGVAGNPLTITASESAGGHVTLWVEFADQWAEWEAFRVRARFMFAVGQAATIANHVREWIREAVTEDAE